MAALRNGMTTVIIPADNEKDLEEIDQTVRAALNFVSTDHVDKILDVALCRVETECGKEEACASVALPVESKEHGKRSIRQ